ncbi:hypothetical protein BDZ94DRAFT_1244473 [Collybia nuda]|uniref:Uncharacterized protein n=1 Tax=Collybia nuda TaxID=64659 RepID=A0A9P5YKE8_9AGAR|nr:hypothetical protein BDZ94DRAFT_1244473 [Collybia nuda]
MSAEYLDEKSRSLSLSVEIPNGCLDPSSSVGSSSNPSPTGILGSRSTSASTSSLPAPILNVTFAPLPQLAPRRRRSTAPLGMAARGQLVRRRREYMDQAYANNPMWTDEELAEQQRVAYAERMKLEEEEGEDPFVALGKMVKVASKNIWRKVSQKDLSKKRKKDEETEQKKSVSADGTVESADAPRETLGEIVQNGDDHTVGAVLDEEERFLTVGQTETIVEGHTKYSWVTGSLEGSERDSTTTSTTASTTTDDDDSSVPVMGNSLIPHAVSV